MVDEKKTVELEVVAQTDRAEQQLNKIATQASTIGQTDKKYAEIAEKHQKQTAKFDKKVNDPRAIKNRERSSGTMLRHEEKRLDLITKQRKELEKYAAIQGKIAAAPGPNNPPPGDGGGGAAGGGGGVGPFATGLKKFAGGAILSLAGAAIGAVSSQISAGFEAYLEYAKAQIGLAGMGATPAGVDQLRDIGSAKYAYSGPETVEQAIAVGRATGNYQAVGQAQALTRGTALQMDESVGLMQTLTQAGTQFGGEGSSNKKGERTLQKLIAQGFSAGISDARLPEYLRGVQAVVQAQGGRRAGEIDATDYGQVFGTLGKYGGPGWQGDRGAAMFQKLNEGIVRPGGGEAGEALMLQAMGFGVPGGTSTYYEAKKKQQQGATVENVRNVVGMVGAQAGYGEEQIMTMAKMLGMDDNWEGVEKMVEVIEQNLGEKMTDEKLQELINETGSAEERAAETLEGIGKVMGESVALQTRLEIIGQNSYESIYAMQIGINKMVDQVLPAANTVLDTISATTTTIANLMGGNIPEHDPNAGVRKMGGMSVVDRKPGQGLGPQWDPTYIAGQQDLPEARRQAIAKLIQENPEAKTMGGRRLQDVYKQLTSGEKGAPSQENQRRMMDKMFGDEGEFAARIDQIVEAATSTARSAAKATEALAEAQRQGNTGPAVHTVPADQVSSMPAPGTVY